MLKEGPINNVMGNMQEEQFQNMLLWHTKYVLLQYNNFSFDVPTCLHNKKLRIIHKMFLRGSRFYPCLQSHNFYPANKKQAGIELFSVNLAGINDSTCHRCLWYY